VSPYLTLAATQICLYLNVVEEDAQLDFLATYGRDIIPAFASQ
jgi:hypothetical protein